MERSSISMLFRSIREGFQKNYQSVIVVFCFFAVWELSVYIFKIPEFILPSPLNALNHLFLPQPDADYHWFLHIRITILEIILGFIITSTIGVLLSIIINWWKPLKSLLLPLFIFINSLPLIAIAPIILLWMGYGIKTNILIAFLVSFFPVIINTSLGLNAVEDDLLDLVRYLHASKLQIFLKIRIPSSLPYIFSGFKISSTMVIVGVIVGEFIASDRGLGYVIINSQYTMDSPPIFAALILVSLAGEVLFGIVSLFEKLLMPWHKF